MKNVMTFFVLVFILALDISQSCAGWLVYHKPEFKGRVIDAETKEPIEGAVVVVEYYTEPLITGPAGGSSTVMSVKETLTDKNGEFYFAPYSTLIQPLSVGHSAQFIIYKPGYGNFPNQQITPWGLTPIDEQIFFSKETGSTGELMMWEKGEKGPEIKKSKVSFGIVELPKLKTREERLKAQPSTPTDIRSKELPLLFKAINEERKNFGLDEVR